MASIVGAAELEMFGVSVEMGACEAVGAFVAVGVSNSVAVGACVGIAVGVLAGVGAEVFVGSMY